MIKDELSYGSHKKVLALLDPSERVVLTMKATKLNEKNKPQDRVIMITSRCFHHMEKMDVRKRLMFSSLKSISLSKPSEEVVLHFKEIELRYTTAKKEFMLSVLLSLIKIPVPVLFLDSVSLASYVCSEKDLKKGICRLPAQGQPLSGVQFTLQMKGVIYQQEGQHISLADFNCIKLLGEGSVSRAMLAELRRSNQLFVIKSLPKEQPIILYEKQREKVESIVAQHKMNPHLVNLAYVFQSQDNIYFCYQYCRAGELFKLLKNQRKLNEKITKFYASQVLMALEKVHQQGLVHRQIKPENIFITKDGHSYLGDYGLAGVSIGDDETTLTGLSCPEYLPPEVIEGMPFTYHGDWWQFGTLLFEMLFGIPPFYNRNQALMFTMIRDCHLSYPSQPPISDQAMNLINALLEKDPQKRLSGNTVRKHPWFKEIIWSRMKDYLVTPPIVPKVEEFSSVDHFDDEMHMFTK